VLPTPLFLPLCLVPARPAAARGTTPVAAVPLAAALILASAGLARPLSAGAQVAPEAWVGCWSIHHVDDWRPRLEGPGFPTGRETPAPTRVLLDRIPDRPGTPGSGSPPSYRAEWESTALRSGEVWEVRSADGRPYIEAVPGVRIQTLLLNDPPLPEVLGMWFFRRTDTQLPEVVAPVEARRMACPEGEGPHQVDEFSALEPHFASRGVEGTFVLYDSRGRRFAHFNSERAAARYPPGSSFELAGALVALQAGLVSADEPPSWEELPGLVPASRWSGALGEYGNRRFTGGENSFWMDGDLTISADEQLYWLVDVLRDRAVPASRRAAQSVVDPVEALRQLAHLEDRGDARLHGRSGWAAPGGDALGWMVGWVDRGPDDLFIFALNFTAGQGGAQLADLQTGELARELGTAILEELGVLPPQD